MYKLHFASWLHTMHLFATFMRNNWKSWSVATFENQHMSVQVIFFPGIVLNFLNGSFIAYFYVYLGVHVEKDKMWFMKSYFSCVVSACAEI